MKRLTQVVCDNCNGPFCSTKACGKLCVHMYECDAACYDYNNGHLCKHIHRIQSIVNSTLTNDKPEIDQLRSDVSQTDMDVDFLEYAGSVVPPQQGCCQRIIAT